MSGVQRRRWPWVLLGLLALLGAGIATLPAEIAWRWLLSGRLAGVEMMGLGGTVWAGHATDVRIRGASLGSLRWQLDASSLLRGAPQLVLHLGGPALTGEAHVRRIAGGVLELPAATLSADARWIGPLLGLPLMQPQGQASLSATAVQIDPDGVPRGGRVEVRWQQAALTGLVQAALGEVQIQAQGQERRWMGTVRNSAGGPLAIDGGFSLVERQYNAEIRLKALAPDDPVVQLLPQIAVPQADGSWLLRIEGQLLPL